MKKFFVVFAVLAAMFLFIGCSKTEEQSKPDEKVANPKEKVVKGDNLQWSKKSSKEMNWNKAAAYCKNLKEGGQNNWRVPNIDELRTLIQNHPSTLAGGTCPISEKAGKLSINDSNDACDDNDDGGNYSKLGDIDWLWSSSSVSDNSKDAWFVSFSTGRVGFINKNSSHGYHSDELIYVRCVR